MDIFVKCASGFKAPLESFRFENNHLKQHSDLEITRLANNILKDGFLFPLTVYKSGEELRIIDGECRILALYNLKQMGHNIPEIPYCLVRVTPDNLKRVMISEVSTNHSVTQHSLTTYTSNEVELKDFAFSTPDLLEFRTMKDIELYDHSLGGVIDKNAKVQINPEDFYGLLAGGN